MDKIERMVGAKGSSELAEDNLANSTFFDIFVQTIRVHLEPGKGVNSPTSLVIGH